MIKIVPFEEKYLDENAKLFAESYSDKDGQWGMEQSKKRVWENVNSFPECCLVALDENNNFIGGILCQKYVNYDGPSLYIDSVHVVKGLRQQGIGKTLIKEAFKKAQDLGVKSVFMYVDSTNEFPGNWYSRMNFAKTKWVAYAAKVEGLKF
ncbi:MAG: GNAT family N-acetyltransferase [Patescibacteria group bacterium]